MQIENFVSTDFARHANDTAPVMVEISALVTIGNATLAKKVVSLIETANVRVGGETTRVMSLKKWVQESAIKIEKLVTALDTGTDVDVASAVSDLRETMSNIPSDTAMFHTNIEKHEEIIKFRLVAWRKNTDPLASPFNRLGI